MEINLRGQIVVLDEAHNIEDAAREAASASITQEQLDGARTELESVADAGVKPVSHRELARVCSVISQWIGRQSDDLEQTDFATSSRVWTGVEMVAALKVMAIGPDEYAHVMVREQTDSGRGDDVVAAIALWVSGGRFPFKKPDSNQNFAN
ncbi:PREDICTED: Fanconi anemia group J protein homolog, partial [Priapulus caudatus]|uniref:Fanconi anemia group J protein homolog n=1 Tax=Priapulus caudatus TaxID=37621 RepID=A0ABM1EZ23_PRICU